MPGAEVATRLRGITLVSLVGPSAVGKTTLMRLAAELDPDFGRIVSFTTRKRREGEGKDTYKYIPHTSATLSQVLRQVTGRELVQFVVHPTGHLYGSYSTAYNKPYMMLDTLPSAFGLLSKLPFREIKKVALVADPNEWRERFDEHLPHANRGERAKRLREGVQNIRWSLDQVDQILWLDNSHRPAAEVAQELIELVKGAKQSSSWAMTTGQQLLNVMQSMV